MSEDNKSWIVPPGLIPSVQKFKTLCDIAKDSPILICGPTGVGKSLFLKFFKEQFKKVHRNDAPIIEANCSHFGGDINIIRSEIFGHLKGSYTGAISPKRGLIEEAEGGALILEETGDLPKEAQAQILTFIETHEYRKLGDIKVRKADVRIIGATNKQEDLRPDLKARFHSFSIPPIHERREDILYYLAIKNPYCLEIMRPFEILALLAYNWPGNVREIEQVGLSLWMGFRMWQEWERNKDQPPELWPPTDNETLSQLNEEYTALNVEKAKMLHQRLSQAGIKTNLLESIMNKYHVGLSRTNTKFPFQDINFKKHKEDPDICGSVFGLKAFDESFSGLLLFCTLFKQDHLANRNLLDAGTLSSPFLPIHWFKEFEKGKNEKLTKSIATFISKIQERDILPKFDIFSLQEKDLLKYYYKGLKGRSKNWMDAGRQAGIGKGIYERKKQLGLK